MMFQINRLAVIRFLSLIFHHFHSVHTIDSEMHDSGVLSVISYQIIIIIIEYGCKRIYEITLVVFTIHTLVLFIKTKILE